jgi:hypothetical protein
MGGASALTYFLWDVGNLTSSLASAVFFGIMGGVSVVFHRREGRGFARLAKVWSVLAFLGLISHIFQVMRVHPRWWRRCSPLGSARRCIAFLGGTAPLPPPPQRSRSRNGSSLAPAPSMISGSTRRGRRRRETCLSRR